MEVPAGADTAWQEEKGSLWTKDHRGKWRKDLLFWSNAVGQTSLPICRARTPMVTEAFLGSFVGLFVNA